MSYFTATTAAPTHTLNCFHLDIRDKHGTLIFTNGETASAPTLFKLVHEFSAAVVADKHQALRYEYREIIDEYDDNYDNDARHMQTCVELTESLLEMIAAAQPQWQISAHAKHI